MRLFVESLDFPVGSACLISYAYSLFMVDHVEFFHTIMHVNLFFLVVYFYCWLYTEFILEDGVMEAQDYLDKEAKEEREAKKKEKKEKKK